jgi:hypothetical protein
MAIDAIVAQSRRRADGFMGNAKSNLPNFLQTQGRQTESSVDGIPEFLIEKLATPKPLT